LPADRHLLQPLLARATPLHVLGHGDVLGRLEFVVQQAPEQIRRGAGLRHVPSPSSLRTSSCSSFWTRCRALNTAATCLPSRRAASAAARPSTAVRRNASQVSTCTRRRTRAAASS